VLVDTLLRACPGFKILATSREPIRMASESTWLVPSLSLPDPRRLPPTAGALRGHPPLRRAGKGHRCGLRADGPERFGGGAALPWVGRYTARFRVCGGKDEGANGRADLGEARRPSYASDHGRPHGAPRHQTLRETLEWSHELLSETGQALSRRLSVFAGGWTLEAAEEVCSEVDENKSSEREDTSGQRAAPGVGRQGYGARFGGVPSLALDPMLQRVDTGLPNRIAA
jgi:hypothetical protein